MMVDYVATYWTVVLEGEVESIEQFDHHMAQFSARPDVKEIMSGYMDLVDSGYREIFRVA